MSDPADDEDLYLCLEGGCFCDDPQLPDQAKQVCPCSCHGDED